MNSINPFDLKEIRRWSLLDHTEMQMKIETANSAFQTWSGFDLRARLYLISALKNILLEEKEKLSRNISLEMGKPITQSRAEIEKCALICDYYVEHAEDQLQDEPIETSATRSWVSYEPLGVILGIMPWNFPFWQVFRFAIPAIAAGNTCLLKHAPNVQQCAHDMEELFLEAGFPDGVFTNLTISIEQTEKVLRHPFVKGVSLTGSTRAGAAVATVAGSEIKKSLLELGGNNAFIVMPDADLDVAIERGFLGRYLNTGQSCIAAKRFIVHESLEHEFVDGLIQKIREHKVGNPTDEQTFFGPLARLDLAETLMKQIKDSIGEGAVLKYGLEQCDCFVSPGILTDVRPGMRVFDEETFGPVAAVTTFKNAEQAIALTNQTIYGLGNSLITSDLEKHRWMFEKLRGGSLFVNDFVASDPRLPFGGTDKSGYGRELAENGIKEFVNTKTYFVR
ncbi:MAG TPA: succinate-semialdehyde dehydrogenase [Flavobacteriales bacterium]|jgi:succinate-semialdehyde dehydrogenase/glutarate-semialdehyde dehydrogenase|nr:succinate-semialdehyde dehydrogenase [Flavobacteriales bacterium]